MTFKRAAITLLPLALAACVTPVASPAGLNGSTWRFTSIDGQAPVSAETSLQFGERLNANVGCNGLSGPWHVEGGRLLLHGPLVATRMFCEGKMEQEAAVGELLSASPTLTILGDTLTLTSTGHTAVLTRASAG
jgi:heat shock protein HslJ